jgi:serine 3-dehydrogenase
MSLQGKVAVVTGATAGIGAAIARELAKAGLKLVLTGRRAARFAQLQREPRVESVSSAIDIANPKAPQRLLNFAMESVGRRDILINSAGILAVGSLETVNLEKLSRMIQVNFEALVRTT